jgi:hypothetical protein
MSAENFVPVYVLRALALKILGGLVYRDLGLDFRVLVTQQGPAQFKVRVRDSKEDLFINGTQNVARELVRTRLLGLAGAAEASAHLRKLGKT